MGRLLLSAITAAFFFQSSPAFSDITWKATLEYMHPYNEEARKVSGGDWGAGAEIEFHLKGVPDFISWAGGVDWVEMLGRRTTFRDSGGTPYIHEINQNYFRFWFGPRWRSHLEVPVRPYIGAQVSLAYYQYSSYLYPPAEYKELIDRDFDFVLGYGVHGGIELRVAPTWSLDMGIKHLRSFGEPRQLSFDSVTVNPSYVLYFLGVRFYP
jgi:hypothetical protein